jgi:hypothetical protein
MADREFVVSRSDGAVPLEAGDPALDRMTPVIVDRVEMRRATATEPSFAAVTRLVGLSGFIQRIPR